jgi:carbon monoxide dehydrogenase subunit G
MKWLLYLVVGVVTVLALAVVVLLAVSRGESRLTASIDINRPPDVVFAWISEPERVRAWVGWLVEIRPLTPQQAQIGAKQVWVMEDRNNNNQLMDIESEIVGLRPPQAMSTRVRAAEGFTGTVDYDLESLGPERTRLNYVASYQFHHWLAKLLEPVIRRSAQQKLEEDLARLKQKAEAEPVGLARGR